MKTLSAAVPLLILVFWTAPAGGDTTTTANLYTGLAYAEILLLAKLTLPNQSRFKPYLYAGSAWGATS